MINHDRLARWAEISANVGVIVTLVLLFMEVRDNTLAVQREASLDRASALNVPFLSDSQVPAILAKVKAVDGVEPLAQAYVERYDLSVEEAQIWVRYQNMIYSGLASDYALLGESSVSADQVRALLQYPDVELWWELVAPRTVSADFLAYVNRIRQGA